MTSTPVAPDEMGGVVHDHHVAFGEIADGLAGLTAGLHQIDDQALTRRVVGGELGHEAAQVDGVDAFGSALSARSAEQVARRTCIRWATARARSPASSSSGTSSSLMRTLTPLARSESMASRPRRARREDDGIGALGQGPDLVDDEAGDDDAAGQQAGAAEDEEMAVHDGRAVDEKGAGRRRVVGALDQVGETGGPDDLAALGHPQPDPGGAQHPGQGGHGRVVHASSGRGRRGADRPPGRPGGRWSPPPIRRRPRWRAWTGARGRPRGRRGRGSRPTMPPAR